MQCHCEQTALAAGLGSKLLLQLLLLLLVRSPFLTHLSPDCHGRTSLIVTGYAAGKGAGQLRPKDAE
jgi:hypothetical protein